VALDATPLLGLRTGVGAFCEGALGALATRPGVDVRAYAVSWRRRGLIEALLPAGVAAHQRPMPARPLHALWGRGNTPPLEWFVGVVDVVHGTNFVVPPTRHAATVVSVHDLTPLHHPELCNEATLAYPGLIRRALARGAWVHTDSAFVAGEVTDAFEVDPARVRVVHPGIPDLPAVAERDAAAALSRLLPSGSRRYCLAVGTAEPRKDLPGLVRAFGEVAARHGDLRLVLAGPPGWGEDALASTVAASPARDRIVRTGWVDERDLAVLLTGATVLAYPSLYEGFGFPPLQAMRAGVPVVATRAGSLPEVLGNGALLVEPGDHDALVLALEASLVDDALRRRLIAAGTTWSSRFSWERCGAGLEELYGDAAGGTRA
jgi:glycosyltransferase involved in cell wall biosynthesis